MVVVEVLAALGSQTEQVRRLAAGWLRQIERNPSITVLPQTADQFDAAFVLYEARPDKSWSLTDCASFIVMEQRGITEALAHDLDFAQAGFRALLRDDVP